MHFISISCVLQLFDTASLVDAQIIKIKLLTSENGNILAEKHLLVEQLSSHTQLLFQKDRDIEKLADQEKQLKVYLDDMQIHQSQCVLAERNARRMIEIEIDNCIERICGFGTVIGDELVECALDAAGVRNSLGAIKDQPTMILIGLMSKISKMSVRMSFIPILWEHHASKQKWKRLQKWKEFFKIRSRATHLHSIQTTRTLRAIQLCCFASWKILFRVKKRLFFMHKEKERRMLFSAFFSFNSVCSAIASARATAARRFHSNHIKIMNHFFTCWTIVTKSAFLTQRQILLRIASQKVSKNVTLSFNKWYFVTGRQKCFQKMCCSSKFKLKVPKIQCQFAYNLDSPFVFRKRCFHYGTSFAMIFTRCKHFALCCKDHHTGKSRDMF